MAMETVLVPPHSEEAKAAALQIIDNLRKSVEAAIDVGQEVCFQMKAHSVPHVSDIVDHMIIGSTFTVKIGRCS